MQKSLTGKRVAVLADNGFQEQDLTTAQRALQPLGASVRVISTGSGLITGWNGEGWGLGFAVDSPLNTALAADFSILIIPGGERSVRKLELTAHTRRFIGGFLDAGKPVVTFGEGLDLIIFSQRAAGRTLSGPDKLKGSTSQAGAIWSDTAYTIDGTLLTAKQANSDTLKAMMDFLLNDTGMERAA
ncbi:MAG: DJ-1/PfpI family protein [Alphaproteobacteria bacterium]|nr:DJ-1/PfpI family protein [Alphaproteobacteria bacterium]